jgi:hypothetical protein
MFHFYNDYTTFRFPVQLSNTLSNLSIVGVIEGLTRLAVAAWMA